MPVKTVNLRFALPQTMSLAFIFTASSVLKHKSQRSLFISSSFNLDGPCDC